MKRRQRRPVLELNQGQASPHGEHPQSKSKQIASGQPGQNVPANPLANLLCQYNSDSDTEDSKKDVHKLDDQVNNFFKEIQLIAPTELVSNNSSNHPLPPNATVKSAQHANQQAQMWRECLDESSGYPYYWHIETNEVTWELPEELRCAKNNATTSTIAKPSAAQESHWVDFSSIAYQQSHENIPEGMIPREVVARNRNRYIRNETAEKHDSQVEQDTANASDVMDEDSDDGKIEMITSFGSDESDSDTTENNQSSNKITSVSTKKSTDVSLTVKSKNVEALAAAVTLPRPPTTLKRKNSDYERKIIRDDVKTEVLVNVNMDDEKNSSKHSKGQVGLPQRPVKKEIDETISKISIDNNNQAAKESASNSCEENVIKKDILCKQNVDSDLDFRVSLVPGYDEDSDPEEETEVVVERKALFPIPQNEDTTENASLSQRSKQVVLDQTRVTDSNDSDTNASTIDKDHVDVQEVEEILEKIANTEDSCGKTEDDTLKLNKFLDNLHGRNKCFQRKKRIAFDVTSGKTKTTDDCETSKIENGTQNAEVNLCIDNDESQKEFNGEYQKECNSVNEDTVESTRSNFKEEPSNTEEQTNTQCDSPENSKEDEEEVNLLTQIILEKLKFLSEGKQSVSPVQLMAIQLQTLFVAWEGGYLEKSYLRRWLTDTGHELERLEQDAAPPGWLCQWDRSHKRYYYQNATTGVTQWTYPDTGIAGGTEEMEICSTPPPAEQEEISISAETEKAEPKPKKPKEDDGELCEKTSEQRASDIEAPPPPQISNPSPPPPPRIFAEDLKKDKRKRDKCSEKLSGKKQRLGEAEVATIADTNQLENPSGFTHSSTPLSPQSSALPNMTNTEPLPPGVDLTEAPYEISATALKRIIYGAVPTQSNSLYDPSARDTAVPILGHPAAIVQEHYLQYPAYHPHLHASAALVLPHKHGVQPAIQIIPDYTPIYTNHKVIEKPPVKTAKESLVSALDSFYNDIARIENSVPEQTPLRPDVTPTEPPPLPAEEVKLEVEPEPVPTEMTPKEKKRKKTRIGISKKHKEVSSMVAKWQKAQQNFEDNT